MRIRTLGCSGGIGGRHFRTTALLVDHDILIDCGTGVADLSIDELADIDHVFITHSHLDHIACLPLMLDTVGDRRDRALTVHALPEVEAILRTHIFNHLIWPDFTRIFTDGEPWMRYSGLALGDMIELDGRRIVPLPANHTVPAVGYRIDSGAGSLVFSGDTGPCPALWREVNAITNLRYLLIETAFPNRERELAERSLHLCPETLAAELAQLHARPEIFVTHLKPGQIEATMEEIEDGIGAFAPRMLQNNQVFEL